MLKYILLLVTLLLFVKTYSEDFDYKEYTKLISESKDKNKSNEERVELANKVIVLSLKSNNDTINLSSIIN
jgi:hypothetical protein